MTPLVDTEPISPERALTPADAATVATAMTTEEIEAFVQALTTEQVPLFLRRLDQATTLVNTAKKIATIRMLEAGRLGERWTSPEGEAFTFEQTKRGEFEDISGLLYVLERLGVPVSALGEAVSGLRVTDLERVAAVHLRDTEPQDGYPRLQEALETIKSHRVWKDGSPRLEPVDNKYRRKTVTGGATSRTG